MWISPPPMSRPSSACPKISKTSTSVERARNRHACTLISRCGEGSDTIAPAAPSRLWVAYLSMAVLSRGSVVASCRGFACASRMHSASERGGGRPSLVRETVGYTDDTPVGIFSTSRSHPASVEVFDFEDPHHPSSMVSLARKSWGRDCQRPPKVPPSQFPPSIRGAHFASPSNWSWFGGPFDPPNWIWKLGMMINGLTSALAW
jgi:hypothetical protein